MLNKNLKYGFCILTTGVSLFWGNSHANAALIARGSDTASRVFLTFDLPAVGGGQVTWNGAVDTYDPGQGNPAKNLVFWKLELALTAFANGQVDGLIMGQHLFNPHPMPPVPGVGQPLGSIFSLIVPPVVGGLQDKKSFNPIEHKHADVMHSDKWDLELFFNPALNKTTLTVVGQHNDCGASVLNPSIIAQISNIIRSTFISPVYAQTILPDICRVPEHSSNLGLLVIGTFGLLGAASTLKRKLKPSQPSEKETPKVS